MTDNGWLALSVAATVATGAVLAPVAVFGAYACCYGASSSEAWKLLLVIFGWGALSLGAVARVLSRRPSGLTRTSAFLFGVLAAFAALLLASRGDLLTNRPTTLEEWSLWTWPLIGGVLCALVCRPSTPRPGTPPPKADTPC